MKKIVYFLLLLLNQNISAQKTSVSIQDVIKNLGTFKNVLLVGYSPADIDTNLIQTLETNHGFNIGFLGFTKGENQQSQIKSNANGPIENGIVNFYYSNNILTRNKARSYFTRALDYPIKDSAILTKIWNKKKLRDDIIFAMADFCPDVILTKDDSLDNNYAKVYMKNCIEQAFQFVKDSVDKAQFNYIKTRKLYSLSSYKYDTLNSAYKFNTMAGDSLLLDNKYYNNWNTLAESDLLDQKIKYLQQLDYSRYERPTLDSMLSVYNSMEEVQYLNDNRITQKYDQLNTTIKEYAGINIKAISNKHKLIIGDSVSITTTISKDTNNFALNCHNFGFKNYDTLFNIHLIDSLVIKKSGTINKTEKISQPKWLSLGLETPGMYKLDNSNDIKGDIDYSRVVSFYCSLDNHSISFSTPVLDSCLQNPIITVPIFVEITPSLVFPNLVSKHKEKNTLQVKLQFNITQNNFPINIKIQRKGVAIAGPNGNIFGAKEKNIFTKDTLLNLKEKDAKTYSFLITHNTILPKDATPENKVTVKAESRQKNDTYVYTSSLREIDIDSMGAYYYHYQPSIVINPDTLEIPTYNPIGVIVPDASYYSDISNSLLQIHIKSKSIFVNKLDLDSIQKIFYNYNFNNENELNNKILEFVNRGGTLITEVTNIDKLPKYIKDSLQINPYYLTENDIDYKLNYNDHQYANMPNKLENNFLQTWKGSVANYSFLYTGNSGWRNLLTIEKDGTQNNLLIQKNIGKGKIILSGLSLDNQLELGITNAYKFILNLL